MDFLRPLGGRLCLDFADTIEDPRGEAVDFLHTYDDLVRWSLHAGALDEPATSELLELAGSDPEGAQGVFERALRLRAAIDGTFREIARGHEPAPDDLRLIQDEYLDAAGLAALARAGGRFDWSWPGERDLTRVRECPGSDDCGWLFYDDSRNRTRRWCRMEGCGSRVKMRRYYAR